MKILYFGFTSRVKDIFVDTLFILFKLIILKQTLYMYIVTQQNKSNPHAMGFVLLEVFEIYYKTFLK